MQQNNQNEQNLQKNQKNVTIIIPTLNEEGNIGRLIDTIRRYHQNADIIVADDGSRDSTQKIASESRAFVLDRSKNQVKGLTASVIDAVMICRTDFFIVMDADFQHPAAKIKEIIEKLGNGSSIIIGNRAKIPDNWPFSRRIISCAARKLGALRLIGRKFNKYDLVSGFFGGKTDFCKSIIEKNYNKFELKGYKVLFDLLKYAPENAKIDEVDYEFCMRAKGESKINKRIMWHYFKSLIK